MSNDTCPSFVAASAHDTSWPLQAAVNRSAAGPTGLSPHAPLAWAPASVIATAPSRTLAPALLRMPAPADRLAGTPPLITTIRVETAPSGRGRWNFPPTYRPV